MFPGGRAGKPLINISMNMLLRRMGRGGLTVHGFRSCFRDRCAEATARPRGAEPGRLASAAPRGRAPWRIRRSAHTFMPALGRRREGRDGRKGPGSAASRGRAPRTRGRPVTDVAAWLRGLGLDQYEAAFRDNGVDASVLPDLTA